MATQCFLFFFWITIFRFDPERFILRFFEFFRKLIYFHRLINNSRHRNIARKFREVIFVFRLGKNSYNPFVRRGNVGWDSQRENIADVSIGLFRTIICIPIGMSKRFCDPIQSRGNQFQTVAHAGLHRRYRDGHDTFPIEKLIASAPWPRLDVCCT